ncbi:uncharacterized protein B0T23DRAFT_397615 [Neurospora hispaniola]|uniref:Uncharacterized protein n=1 Tax=Neurospora hispaniola TaxID=588809 RepID=A0AAJ0MP98_9PEZI|nr:hypothetical protein B0T23DRAFT_397615 [Neurospora hispaniola]
MAYGPGRGNPVKEEGDSKGQRMTLSQSSSASIGKARQQKKTLGLEKHSEQAHESVLLRKRADMMSDEGIHMPTQVPQDAQLNQVIHKFQLTGTKKALPLRQINIMLSLSCPDCDGEGHRPSLSLGPTVHLAGLGTLAAYAPAWQEVPTQFDMELLVHLSAMKLTCQLDERSSAIAIIQVSIGKHCLLRRRKPSPPGFQLLRFY